MQHSNDASTFMVGNIVENFVDLIRMADWNFDGVRILETVEIQGCRVDIVDELGPNIKVREQVVDAQELHKRGITFI